MPLITLPQKRLPQIVQSSSEGEGSSQAQKSGYRMMYDALPLTEKNQVPGTKSSLKSANVELV